MTDEEAADWHGYDEPTSRKLEDTRRERRRNDKPAVDPPAGTSTGRESAASAPS